MSYWYCNFFGVVWILQDVLDFWVVFAAILAVVWEFAIWLTIFLGILLETNCCWFNKSYTSFFTVAVACNTGKIRDQQILFKFLIRGFLYLSRIWAWQKSNWYTRTFLFFPQYVKIFDRFSKSWVEKKLNFLSSYKNQNLNTDVERAKERDNFFYVQSGTVFFLGLNFEPIDN